MPLNQILFNRMKIDKINLYIGLIQNKIKSITDEADAIQITLQALPIDVTGYARVPPGREMGVG